MHISHGIMNRAWAAAICWRQRAARAWVRGYSTSDTAVPVQHPAVCVWGANTGVGKTLISAGLAQAAIRANVRACQLQQEQCSTHPAYASGAYMAPAWTCKKQQSEQELITLCRSAAPPALPEACPNWLPSGLGLAPGGELTAMSRWRPCLWAHCSQPMQVVAATVRTCAAVMCCTCPVAYTMMTAVTCAAVHAVLCLLFGSSQGMHCNQRCQPQLGDSLLSVFVCCFRKPAAKQWPLPATPMMLHALPPSRRACCSRMRTLSARM